MRAATLRLRFVLLPAIVAALLALPAVAQQEASSSLVEVFFNGSKVVGVPGLTAALSEDENVCRAVIKNDQLELYGLQQGETIVLAWAGATRYTYRVNVVAPPVTVRPRLTLPRDRLEAGQGSFSTSFLRSSSGGPSFSLLLSQMDWTQASDGRGITMRAQTEDQFAGSGRNFDLNSALVQIFTPNSNVSVGDFLLTSPIESESRIVPAFTYNNVVLRGGDVWFRHGANRFEAFAGTTVPPYFLSLSGTRSTAGFSITHKFSNNLFASSSTGFVSYPLLNASTGRQTVPYQTVSLAFAHRHWKAEVMGGGSTRGALFQASASYEGRSGMAYGTFRRSSAEFPLDQLQLFYTGGSSMSAGGTYHLTTRVTLSGYAQHSTSPALRGFGATTGNYVSPNATIRINNRNQAVVNYAFTSLDQASSTHTVAHRVDVSLNSQFGTSFSNTAQIIVGTLRDRSEVRSENDLTLRDIVTIPVKFGTLSFGIQHVRTDPSLVSRLTSNLGLLTPAESAALLTDPLAFANTYPLDPQTRLLLSEIQPSTTEVTAGGQFNLARRLTFSPTVHLAHQASSVLGLSSLQTSFSYSLAFNVTPTFLLQSSLSQIFDWASVGSLRRSNAFTFGIRKMFQGSPTAFVTRHRAEINGRICMDANVDGRCSDSEPGLSGIKVVLDNRIDSITDAQGNFRFRNVHPGAHRVSLSTQQFQRPVRFTSVSDIPVEVGNNNASLEFSVVNFARVMGNVFNDYALDHLRQPDAPGLPRVRLTLSSSAGFSRTVLSDGSGDFEMMQVPPGEYRLTVDAATIPLDYILGETPAILHVEPVSTVVHDVALRALRSMGGHIYYKQLSTAVPPQNQSSGPSAQEPGTPVSGVRVRVANEVVVTDESGAFFARNLPAGEISVQVLPATGDQVPAGVRLPSGRVRLSKEPVQLNNVRIVITDSEVLRVVRPAGN